jgi:DnaK suppressor protein
MPNEPLRESICAARTLRHATCSLKLPRCNHLGSSLLTEHMTNHRLGQYRRQLIDLAHRLGGDVRSVAGEAMRTTGGEASGNLSNAPLHMADLGTDNFDQEVSLSLLENEQEILHQTASALDRLDEGTYGRCTDCGKPIGERRLGALPYTPYCMSCARLHEENGD